VVGGQVVGVRAAIRATHVHRAHPGRRADVMLPQRDRGLGDLLQQPRDVERGLGDASGDGRLDLRPPE
jgi:hypothetical protein